MARIDIEGLTMKNISPLGGALVEKFQFSNFSVNKICLVLEIITKGIIIIFYIYLDKNYINSCQNSKMSL